MIRIDEVKELKGDFGVNEKLVAASAKLSSLLFSCEGKFVGGVGREALTSPPEVWLAAGPELQAGDVRSMRAAVRELARRFSYIRAKVALNDKKAARFAFALGFMWEEDTSAFHYFSVRN